MKKIFLMMIFMGSVHLQAQEFTTLSFNQKRSPGWSTFFKDIFNKTVNTVPACAIAGTLGLCSGAATAILDRYVPFFVVWAAEMYVRNQALETIENGMEENNIDYDKTTLYWTARIASWLGWIIRLRNIDLKNSGVMIREYTVKAV